MTPPRPLWRPSADTVAAATLTRYTRWLEERSGEAFPDYASLWSWSVSNLEQFWASIRDFYEVAATPPDGRVLGSRAMPGAEWFPGAELSYAEHVFRNRRPEAVALVAADEAGESAEWTWAELSRRTAACADGLRAHGIAPGDRVAAYLPNVPEAVVAFLACASIGAVWSSCSPDFGAGSVVDRFAQIEPRILIAADGYRYGGKEFERATTLTELRRRLPTVETTVVVESGIRDGDGPVPGTIAWRELLAGGTAEAPSFTRLPFDHPLWILYSSGTTGLPKALVHGQGGILLEHLKLCGLHMDLRAGDRFFWFTTTGWTMWNILLGGLLVDAAIVLYDGSPGHPGIEALWDMAARVGITCFGASAAYIAASMKGGAEPRRGRDLSRLRSLGSTGSPLAPEGFRWVYDHVGHDTWLFSTSGGTDVCSAFVGGVPTLPVYEGELQARALGAAVHAFDEGGRAVVGEVGELVITEPLPSMPLGLWGDDEAGSRYHESYFSTYPGVWRHGDWIEITDRGTAVIYGRSDSTINRGGVRMGTSEIYRAVLAVDEVVDAVVVDVPRPDGGAWMPLFVVLRAGARLDERLEAEIRRQVAAYCSPRHVPDEVRQIVEVPRTLSGKVLEIPVKRILMGEPAERVASRDSLANPGALDAFVELARRQAAPS